MGRRNGEKRDEAVAVAIDKDKTSQYALKWAVDHLLGRGQALTLIHVKTRPSSIPTSMGNTVSLSDLKDDVAKAYKQQLENQARELFTPFRCFCTRKEIQCKEVVLEEGDIAKAIIDYVSSVPIEILVMGAPSRSGIFRRFKTTDVPSSVCKGAPDFCTVYVISKGKISAAKPASTPPPAKVALQNTFNNHQPSQNPPPNDGRVLQHQILRVAGAERAASLMPRNKNDDFEIKSPFNRCGPSSNKSYELSIPDSDISFVSSGRPSIDRMFPSLHESFEPGRLSSGSDWDARSFASSVGNMSFDTNQQPDYSFTSENGRMSTSSPQSLEDIEAEMRRLKLELKQTMDMYSTACKEALSAKQKQLTQATELHRWKLEEQQKYEEARLAEEAALAIAEKEKAKCKAAMEAAEAAQRIAEREAQKRINAERKAIEEAEERKKILNTMGQTDYRYRKYSIEEIEEATRNFVEALKIGEGGYGPVYRCTLNHTPVAIKVLRPDAAHGRTQFQQEVEVLSCIRHPNMVLLLGACPEYGCLVYEYMANGSLDDRLFRRGNTPPISWQLRFRIAAEIGTGLLFLHQTKPEPIVHRDLKPGNILLDRNFVSKISDVGLARLVPPSVADSVTQYRMTSTAGTFCYIDPEYQQTGMLGIKSDIYSLGVMFLQILTAKPPMGLTHTVERAIERGNFEEILDPAVPDWPVEEALVFAKLALKCAELRRKDRPDLGNVVLPELNRLRALAEDSMSSSMPNSSTGASSGNSSTISQDVMSDPQLQQYVSEASSSSSLVPRRISTAE